MKLCWQCGKPLRDAFGRPVRGVWRETPRDGYLVKLHKVCARTFDEDNRKVTAQPSQEHCRR